MLCTSPEAQLLSPPGKGLTIWDTGEGESSTQAGNFCQQSEDCDGMKMDVNNNLVRTGISGEEMLAQSTYFVTEGADASLL